MHFRQRVHTCRMWWPVFNMTVGQENRDEKRARDEAGKKVVKD